MNFRLNTTTYALTLGLLSALSSSPLLAAQADDIQVSDPFTREMPPGAFASAAFMTLTNQSDQNIQLVKASTNVAKSAELHTHTNNNGVMRMRQVSFFEIPAKGEAKLQPGGNHIMLISPTQPIQAGHNVTVTLTFKDGSSKQVDMPVKSIMKQVMKQHDHDHKHHH
ncbi:Copper metallochaperone PCu(A)C, inserts Cu(I) into cytochrome oxidase subunit II [hydrothermal vent metagenome]|uniref:Copper metallochaperone PCu(A)C, inserts Cu(I) into cytochrome oxidase subunit II n=1 Tax=hydrothermal vent metagenome TaxID=652676 RepID=A0A3B0WJE0_9ZZZZ